MMAVLHKITQEHLMCDKRWHFMIMDVNEWTSEQYEGFLLITDQGLQSLDFEISSLTFAAFLTFAQRITNHIDVVWDPWERTFYVIIVLAYNN
jgi:hypothetical protein